MTYLVTARKWRPMVFDDVVGQTHVATTLRNAIASNRLSHAYLFSGPRGVGKTTMARILAKAINCKSPKEFNPDNTCERCKEITEGRSIDVLEIDGASNRGVEEIRNLRESVRYPPAKGTYKVYIIDEVHMLTKEAFNALLKTLEEPPTHTLFIFATTEVHKVPPTILSRCQRFDFRRISVEEIMGSLGAIAREENITISDEALLVIAKKADGSLRDAQSIFDQVVSFCGETIDLQSILQALNIVDEEMYFRVTQLIQTKDTRGGLALVEEIINRGYDIKEFLNGLNEHFRNILTTLMTGSTHLIETSNVFKKRYEEESRKFTERDIFRLMKIVSDMTAALRWTDQPRFKLEVGLLQMIKMDSSVQLEQLLQELERVKQRINGPGTREERSADLFSATDVKVTGSVKASPPSTSTTTPRQMWTQPAPIQHNNVSTPLGEWSKPSSIGFQTATTPQERPDQHLVTTSPYAANKISSTGTLEHQQTISIEAAAEKWQTVIEEATKHRVMVGTMLRESHFGGIEGNRLRVHCPDDVHLSLLKRNREYLADLLQHVYGARIHLDANLVSTDHSTPTATEHPVIAALKKELGAERID